MKSSLLFSALLSVSAHAAEVFPGIPWNDTDGNELQAHGGGLVVEGDTYYLIGENKTSREGNDGGSHFNSVSVSSSMNNNTFQTSAIPEEILTMFVVLPIHKLVGLGVCERPPFP